MDQSNWNSWLLFTPATMCRHAKPMITSSVEYLYHTDSDQGLYILQTGWETERHLATQIPYYVPKTVIILLHTQQRPSNVSQETIDSFI